MYLELRTIAGMVRMYCRAHHGSRRGPLCSDCAVLLEYARERIDNCPFGDAKPVCNRCTVHCCRPEMRTRICEIMRYAGPRMLWRHPALAIRHLWRSRRNLEH